MSTPHASKADYDRALNGVDFPVAKDAVVRASMDKGGIDAEVRSVMRSLPEESFDSREDLDRSITRAYERGEGFLDFAPAVGQRESPQLPSG